MTIDTEADAITQRVCALFGAAFVQAFVTLDKCLLNSGALKPGEFSEALKGSFNHPGADWERLDYTTLQLLAKQIDEAETNDRKPQDEK